jgi:hypothetical protein
MIIFTITLIAKRVVSFVEVSIQINSVDIGKLVVEIDVVGTIVDVVVDDG